METQTEQGKVLENGWIEFGNGKYKDKFGIFWMCECGKIYRTEKGYINHIYNQRCKE